jgi:hypothetical protein
VKRSTVALLALLLPLAACGPGGHDPVPDPDQEPDPGPPLLPCGAPLPFSLPGLAGTGSGSTMTLSSLAVMATGGAYVLLAVDSAGGVHGYVYSADAGGLTVRTYDIPVVRSGATGPVTVVETFDGFLAAVESGRPSPSGTALIPLDPRLGPRGPSQMELASSSLDSAIASTGAGVLAFLGAQPDGAVTAKQVSPAGTDVGASRLVIDSTEAPSAATILAAGERFLVTWTATAPSPNEVRAEIIDSQMSVITPPVAINPGAIFDGDNPRVGHALSGDRYLFAWSSTTASGDELWVSLRDGKLTELRAIRLSTHGVLPRVAGGQDDFLVAWKDTSTTSGIAAARVRLDGSVTPLVVSGKGGTALAWDLATRYGQPALIWVEDGATPGGWVDPLCR